MAAELNDIKNHIRQDDYTAFKQLYLLTYKPLLRFALIYTHNTHLAEDVLSDVFLKLWTRRDKLDEVQNLRVYLYTAVKNTALNYRNRQMTDWEENDPVEEQASGYPDPEKSLIAADTERRIRQAVHALPPRCKLIFQLAKEEGLRYKDIADILGVSVKTIDSQLAIALSRIAVALHPADRKKLSQK